MRISVTQSDINKGDKRNAHSCAVARAVRRATKAKEVSITYGVISVGRKEFAMSSQVSNFISDFDAYLNVKPFSFTLPRVKLYKTKKTAIRKTTKKGVTLVTNGTNTTGSNNHSMTLVTVK